MRSLLLSLSVLSVCFIFGSCSRAPERQSVKIEDKSITQSDPDSVSASRPVSPTVPEVKPNGDQKFGEERLLGDNSRVTVSYDGSGNKTETRVFPDGSEVKFVRVYTARDGTVEATIYQQNGNARSVPSGMARGILSAPVGEISKTVNPTLSEPTPQAQPITESRPEVARTTPAVQETRPSVPDTSSVQLPPVAKAKPPAK